eukprot:4833215-Pleurochrysis_carterae.AAC.1
MPTTTRRLHPSSPMITLAWAVRDRTGRFDESRRRKDEHGPCSRQPSAPQARSSASGSAPPQSLSQPEL